MSSDPNDPLEVLLNRDPEVPPPTDIQREVWRKISLSEDLDDEPNIVPLIHSWFARWPFAALFIASCALAGGLWAEVQANQMERNRNAQFVRSYLVLIDPLLQEISTDRPS